MTSYFEDLGKFFVKDNIVIINSKAVVCLDNKEPRILNGNIENIIFHNDWGVTLVTADQEQSRKIYSMILNHRLFRKLQMLSELEGIKQGAITS